MTDKDMLELGELFCAAAGPTIELQAVGHFTLENDPTHTTYLEFDFRLPSLGIAHQIVGSPADADVDDEIARQCGAAAAEWAAEKIARRGAKH